MCWALLGTGRVSMLRWQSQGLEEANSTLLSVRLLVPLSEALAVQEADSL